MSCRSLCGAFFCCVSILHQVFETVIFLSQLMLASSWTTQWWTLWLSTTVVCPAWDTGWVAITFCHHVVLSWCQISPVFNHCFKVGYNASYSIDVTLWRFVPSSTEQATVNIWLPECWQQHSVNHNQGSVNLCLWFVQMAAIQCDPSLNQSWHSISCSYYCECFKHCYAKGSYNIQEVRPLQQYLGTAKGYCCCKLQEWALLCSPSLHCMMSSWSQIWNLVGAKPNMWHCSGLAKRNFEFPSTSWNILLQKIGSSVW